MEGLGGWDCRLVGWLLIGGLTDGESLAVVCV